jgi:hemerythrin
MIEFDPVLLTGVDAIDAQHRELFLRVNRLIEASRARRSKEEVHHLLEFLGSYVVEHFESEERTMAECGYPRIEGHVGEHRQFVRELESLQQEARRQGPTPLLVIHVTSRTTEWLREHIYRTDRLLGDWIRRNPRRS